MSLAPLLAALAGAGLTVGVEETLRLHHVLSLAPSLDREGLCNVVRSIVVKSAEDREVFERVFDLWWREVEQTADLLAEKAPRRAPLVEPAPLPSVAPAAWRRWALGGLAVAAAALLALFVWKKLHPGQQDTNPPPPTTAVPTASLSAQAGAPEAPSPSPSAPTVKDDTPKLPPRPTHFVTQVPHITITSNRLPAALGMWFGIAALGMGLLVWILAGKKRMLPEAKPRAIKTGPLSLSSSVGEAAPELLSHAERDRVVYGIGRYVSDEQTRVLDVERSVLATSQAAGVPELRYCAARYPREVWLWVDESADNPLMDRLADDISSALGSGGLPVERATFWGFPDRLRRDRGEEFAPIEVDERRDAAIVVVLTDGRLLDKLASSSAGKRDVDRALRALTAWPRLAFVDFGAENVGIHVNRHGIKLLTPDKIVLFLADETEPVGIVRDKAPREARLWAAACAMSPEPVRQETALALRRALHLSVSPMELMALYAGPLGAGRGLQWSKEERADLLRWLLALGDSAEALLGRAAAFWQGYYERAIREASGYADTLGEKRLWMGKALVELWLDPAAAAGVLYKELYAGELRAIIHGHLGDMREKGAAGGGIMMPWKLADLPLEAQGMLLEMGFGKGAGVVLTSAEVLRRPGRVGLSMGMCFGLGACVLGWWAMQLREPQVDKPPPTPDGGWVSLVRGGVDWWTVRAGNRYLGRSARVEVLESATVVWESESVPCVEPLDRGEIRSCGKRPKPERPKGSWPEQSMVVIQASKGDPSALALSDVLLDSGTADVVVIHEDWRMAVCGASGAPRVGLTSRSGLLFVPQAIEVTTAACPSLNDLTIVEVIPYKDDLPSLALALWFEGERPVHSVWPQARLLVGKEVGRAIGWTMCPPGMALIPGGTFWMGSTGDDKDADSDERPRHEVKLDAYCLDKTEVTVNAFKPCAATKQNDAQCGPVQVTVEWSGYTPEEIKFWSKFCTGDKSDHGDHPINCVDWTQADMYCRWAGKRLPTEAEWEHAARGGDDRKYPWGNEKPDKSRLNACGKECREMGAKLGRPGWVVMYEEDDGYGATAPVGQFPPNPYGLLDMAGNVWEWTADWYAPYEKSKEALVNPKGPDKAPPDPRRVLRGGGWCNDYPSWVRAAVRNRIALSDRIINVGFRCASGLIP